MTIMYHYFFRLFYKKNSSFFAQAGRVEQGNRSGVRSRTLFYMVVHHGINHRKSSIIILRYYLLCVVEKKVRISITIDGSVLRDVDNLLNKVRKEQIDKGEISLWSRSHILEKLIREAMERVSS